MAVFCLKSCMLAFSIMQTKDLPDVQAGFWKGRETRDQIANIHWITKKARELLKNTYLCFIDHAKVFDCVDSNKLLKALKEMAIPDHLNCLLRNLYAGQEATVRTMCGATEKGVQRGCLLSPCLLNLYAEHLMKNAGLDELQAGIKIGGRNIHNLMCRWYHAGGRKPRGTKGLLMRVKEKN